MLLGNLENFSLLLASSIELPNIINSNESYSADHVMLSHLAGHKIWFKAKVDKMKQNADGVSESDDRESSSSPANVTEECTAQEQHTENKSDRTIPEPGLSNSVNNCPDPSAAISSASTDEEIIQGDGDKCAIDPEKGQEQPVPAST